MKSILILFFIFKIGLIGAQSNLFKNDPHHVEHIGLKESFFGAEDDYMVCYPKSHRNLFTMIIALGLATSLSIGYALYIQRKSNKKLSFINKIIEEKNNDVTASINYSKRIQNAMLPELPNSINVSNSLIIYKPKDIVSGDTYWIDEIDNHKFFIIADCTGHGVPGALLTMLVNTAIQKALFENKLINPSLILESINNQIKSSLKQNAESSIQDSVDMSVVIINTSTNELQFAGANSNLFLMQNNQVQLIKGSKCTVGSIQTHVTEAPVTTNFMVKQNDSFIIYTDGIVDQIGGKEKNKLKRKGLQTIIEESLSIDFLNSLNTKIENWISKNEQVDDITMIAFKIV
jgi:serine phosphatase RsbU (regulator of sigma subunit)